MQLLLLLISFSLFAADWKDVDQSIQVAIREEVLPGGLLVVGRQNQIVKRGIYGDATQDTIYDIASLSKVVGTATAVMILLDEGKLSLDQKLSDFYPDYKKYPKNLVTIRHLLQHNSGLPSSIRAFPGESYDHFIERASELPLMNFPGKETVYSDAGFIILGDIVQKVSGMSLHEFTKKKIFEPLKMKDTSYYVSEEELHRCAPTTRDQICIPHDPKSRAMFPHNLGHAGIFSTIEDLSRFARMYLNQGTLDGVRILSRETVNLMTTLRPGDLRGLGWDFISPYATAPRGEVFPAGISYGHTGFTGTTLWIDPKSDSYYVFLSNRVYLGEERTGTPFTRLRKQLSTLIGSLIYSSSSVETLQ